MKSILLIGLGRFGRHIAIKLDELHHQVMAVDKEDTRVDAVLPFVTNAQINTIEKPARVIWQNDINCMKGLFVEKLRDFSERFLLSATRPNGKKEEKVV